ncbi:unnamed protein product [Eruca vesicaria subsp. sativa]|uniref:Thioredoxin domain-containing protein n=1 Tax=Eruca vesicaria subsp. sativa TaxID=29727 RepID=A0ABC8J2U5_ERUVS|nr:unnamed protein product [Eruca vesicaria subsp. sativa]
MEKRIVYGLVVMLMYLVGGGYSQGVVKRIRDKAEWEAILADADHYIGLIVTSPLCGSPCAILNDQVAQIVDSFNSVGVRIQFFTAYLWQAFILSDWIKSVPTVLIFEHGNVTISYGNLSDWGNFYDILFGSGIFNFAPAPSPSPSPSPSDANLPLPPQSGL